MSELANCLGAQGISIEALIQKPPKAPGDAVSVLVLSNEAERAALRRVVQAIGAMHAVREAPQVIPVEV